MNLTPEERTEIKNAVLLAVTVVVWVLAFCVWFCPPAKADYVLEFGATWCGPCQQQKPIVEQVRREGYDVRPVDYDKCPELVRYYRIRSVPTCVYVYEYAGNSYDSGARIVGLATAGQLRRFCYFPGVVTVGAASRNAVRALFSPYPMLEW